MLIGALGDIHGAFETVQEIMTRHADVPLWVCVGDVASNAGEYFTPVSPLYWIKGNNEDFDVIAERDRWPIARADAALPSQRWAAPRRTVARCGARRHICAKLVQHAGGIAAAIAWPQGVGRRAEAGKKPRR